MVRIKICISLMIILLIGCSGRPITQSSGVLNQSLVGNTIPAPATVVDNPSAAEQPKAPRVETSLEKTAPSYDKIELSKAQQAKENFATVGETFREEKVADIPPKSESSNADLRRSSASASTAKKITLSTAKNETSKSKPKANQSKQQIQDGPQEYLED